MLDNFYPHSIEATGQYLRLALQQISKHHLPYNPISYAVWYEYALGRNTELNNEITALEENGTKIPFETVTRWFRTYIADAQAMLAAARTQEFKNILSEATRHIGDSGNRLNQSGDRLETYTSRLDHAASAVDVKEISEDIISETRSIIRDNDSLQREMDETISEIDALKAELEGMKQAAKTDALTGLLNRRGFDEALSSALENAKENSAPLSAIIADIDHFKKVNDTHGHLIGDNVLKILAKLLKDHTKGKDIAARFGGEEFIIVLPDTRLKGGFTVAEQIRLSLQNMRWRTKNSGKSIGTLTISMGVSQYRPEEPVDAFIQRADKALYLAKEKGRNRTITETEAA